VDPGWYQFWHMVRATAMDPAGQTLDAAEHAAVADGEDRIVYFHEEYDNSGGPPRVVFAADSPAIADGPQECPPAQSRRSNADCGREAERREIMEELKRLEILEDAAAEEEAQQAGEPWRNEEPEQVSARTGHRKSSPEFAAFARGFLDNDKKSTMKNTQVSSCKMPPQAGKKETGANNLVKTSMNCSAASKQEMNTFEDPCPTKTGLRRSVLKRTPTFGSATTRLGAKNTAVFEPLVQETITPIERRKKRVTFADQFATGFGGDKEPSGVQRSNREDEESRPHLDSQTGPQPSTVVWAAPDYYSGNSGCEGSLQRSVLEAVEEAANEDENSEPSDRLAFIENLLRLEAEEGHRERSYVGEQAEDLDSSDDESDSANNSLDLRRRQVGAIKNAAPGEDDEFETGFISRVLEQKCARNSKEAMSSICGPSDLSRSDEADEAVEADLAVDTLQFGKSAPSDLRGVDVTQRYMEVNTHGASSPDDVEGVIQAARRAPSLRARKVTAGQSPGGMRRQCSNEQDGKASGCDRSSCSNSEGIQKEGEALETLSDVVRERSTARRRSRPKRRPRHQLGMQIPPVLEIAGSCLPRGSVAFPEESDAVHVDNENEDMETPKLSRFKALHVSSARAIG
jgi:hypothetical protein